MPCRAFLDRLARHHYRLLRTQVSRPRESYEFRRLVRYCRMNPKLRQYRVRDDLANMNPGVIGMSTAMQVAYMRVYRTHDKSDIRRALVDLVPILIYRAEDDRRHLFNDLNAEEMLPSNQPGTLNEIKRKMWTRRESLDDLNKNMLIVDEKAQAQLRREIKMKLKKFHKKIALFNAIENRTALYDSMDSVAFFLYRAPAMYAATYRVFHELSKLMPLFVPKSVLDFGAGTGTTLLAIKEVYDPESMVRTSPTMRHLKRTFFHNVSHRKYTFGLLNDETSEVANTNTRRRRSRFMTVLGMLRRGEIDMKFIPLDLQRELIRVGANAIERVKNRLGLTRSLERGEKQYNIKGIWTQESDEKVDQLQYFVSTLHEDSAKADVIAEDDAKNKTSKTSDEIDEESKTWWEKLVEVQHKMNQRDSKLRPMQHIIAIEPSQGMMETAMVNLAEELPLVHWRRYLAADDADGREDLVVAAYTFSEIPTSSARKSALEKLWKRTGKVLVIIDHASIACFAIMMELREALRDMAGIGVWNEQPTIIAPCPHERRCPMQHCCVGTKDKTMRVCHATVGFDLTFVEKWVRRTRCSRAKEKFCYLVVARNEVAPTRKERAEKKNARTKQEDDAAQRSRQVELARELEKTNHYEKNLEAASSEGGADDNIKDDEHPNSPTKLLVPCHKYNRLSNTSHVQNATRIIGKNELYVVRSEIDEYSTHFLKELHGYSRIVKEPVHRGHMWATFCNKEGELVRGKVYRRCYARDSKLYPRSHLPPTKKWQIMGGWKLLKSSVCGGLFPPELPLFSKRVYEQMETPNTFIDDANNTHLEKTSMVLGTPREHRFTSETPTKDGVSFEDEVSGNVSPKFRAHEIKDELLHSFSAGHDVSVVKSKGGLSNIHKNSHTYQCAQVQGQAKPDSMQSPEVRGRKVSTEEWSRVVRGTSRALAKKMKLRKIIPMRDRNLRDKQKPKYVP